MKKFIVLFLLLLMPIVIADTYQITTVDKCDGFVLARMYGDNEYSFRDCQLNGNLYACPCSLNRKIILDTTIEEKHKVVVEYYREKYKDSSSKITQEIWIEPSQADKKEVAQRIKIKQRTMFTIIGIILLIVISIVGAALYFIYNWYVKILTEE